MPVPALVVLEAIGPVAVLVAVLLRRERRRLAERWQGGGRSPRRPWGGLARDFIAVARVSRREPRAIDVTALVQAGGLLAQHRG